MAYSHTFQDDKTLVIGLHLRSGMDENIRDVAILFNHDRDAVLRAAQKCLPAAIKRERSVSRYHEVVVIVACDNSRLRQKALNELVEIPGITKAVAFAPSKEASRGKTGMFYAVMDLFLLSQSDVIVRSGKMTSMFTTLASGLMIRGSMQPVYMAPVVTPTFYQCDTSNRACGVSLNRDSPKLGIVESVITNHNEDQVGTCFHGAVKTAEMLRNRGVLYPNCEELLSIDSRAHGGAGYSSSSSNKDGAILNDRALDVDVNGIGGFVEKFWNLFKY